MTWVVSLFFPLIFLFEGIILPYSGDYVVTNTCHPDGWGNYVGGYPSTCAIDISAGCGEPIISPVSGDFISYADDGLQLGNTAAIIKGNQYIVFLLHGDYLNLSKVSQGDLIGYEASHGNSTGCHTHLSVFDNINKKWVNPLSLGDVTSIVDVTQIEDVPIPSTEVLALLSGMDFIVSEQEIIAPTVGYIQTVEPIKLSTPSSLGEDTSTEIFSIQRINAKEKIVLVIVLIATLLILLFFGRKRFVGLYTFLLLLLIIGSLLCALGVNEQQSINLLQGKVNTLLQSTTQADAELPEFRQAEFVTKVVLDLDFIGKNSEQDSLAIDPISPQWPKEIQQWNTEIESAAIKSGIDPNWLAAVMYQESRGNAQALSSVCAAGLIQVMPSDGSLDENGQCAEKTEENLLRYQNYFSSNNTFYFRDRPTQIQLLDPSFNLEYGSTYLADLIQKHGSIAEALRYYGGTGYGEQYVNAVSDHYACVVNEDYERCHDGLLGMR